MNSPVFHDCYSPVTESGCWLWIGSVDKDGYGIMSANGRTIRAHRFSYETFCGEIPKGLLVLHSCDVPSCVRPAHLRVGTQADNMADMMRRGRDRSLGERNPYAKLTLSTVLEIIRSPVNNRADRLSLAKRHGLSLSHVNNIKSGHRWGWVSK